MILTEEERNKFASYLEQDAKDGDAIEQQMANLGDYTDPIRKQIRVESMAARVIAKKLRSTESMEVS